MSSLLQRLDAWANPVLIKEIAQGFRGRGLVAGSGLALLYCLTVYCVIAITSTPGAESGEELFWAINHSVVAVVLVIVPLGTARLLQSDIENGTLELISITGMSLDRNLNGRLQAALAKVALMFALTAPFTLVCVLLGGISFGDVITALVVESSVAVAMCGMAIMLSSLAGMGAPIIKLALRGLYVIYPAIGLITLEGLRNALLPISSASGFPYLLACGFAGAIMLTVVTVRAGAVVLSPTVHMAGLLRATSTFVLLATFPLVSVWLDHPQGSAALAVTNIAAVICVLCICIPWSALPPIVAGATAGQWPACVYLFAVNVFLAATATFGGLSSEFAGFNILAILYFPLLTGIAHFGRELIDPHGRKPLAYLTVFVAVGFVAVLGNIMLIQMGAHIDDALLILVPFAFLIDSDLMWSPFCLVPSFAGVGLVIVAGRMATRRRELHGHHA